MTVKYFSDGQNIGMLGVLRFISNNNTGVFVISGSAGTGKTMLLNKIKEQLMQLNLISAVCAPTGRAASNINGRTIHSIIYGHKVIVRNVLQDDGTIKRVEEYIRVKIPTEEIVES